MGGGAPEVRRVSANQAQVESRRKPEARSDPPSGFCVPDRRPAVSETAKETKAQRAERLKQALNPWEAYAEILRFAREGYASIPPEWGMYFRWWGIYSQGDGIGAVGGKGGEGKSVPYFMVRIRIPNGSLKAHQLRAIAGL